MLSVAESTPGVSDAVVLAAAVDQDLILLTLDRDYGDLIFHRGYPAPAGVILFRLAGLRPQDDNQRILRILQQPAAWTGRFTTVTDALVRSRKLPRAAGN